MRVAHNMQAGPTLSLGGPYCQYYLVELGRSLSLFRPGLFQVPSPSMFLFRFSSGFLLACLSATSEERQKRLDHRPEGVSLAEVL